MGETKFAVLSLPPPYATLDGRLKFEGREYLMKSKGLSLHMLGFDWAVPYIVSSFDLVIMQEGCIIKRLESKDAFLTNEMRATLNQVELGDILIFENIKAIHTKEKMVVVVDPETYEDVNTGIPRNPIDINDFKIEIKFIDDKK